MIVSTNAYKILFSRKRSGKFIITIKTFDFIDSFFSQLLSFQQVWVLRYSLLILNSTFRNWKYFCIFLKTISLGPKSRFGAFSFCLKFLMRWGTHLYMSLFPSIHLPVCPSVHPSVCPSVVQHISGTVHHLVIIFGTLM